MLTKSSLADGRATRWRPNFPGSLIARHGCSVCPPVGSGAMAQVVVGLGCEADGGTTTGRAGTATTGSGVAPVVAAHASRHHRPNCSMCRGCSRANRSQTLDSTTTCLFVPNPTAASAILVTYEGTNASPVIQPLQLLLQLHDGAQRSKRVEVLDLRVCAVASLVWGTSPQCLGKCLIMQIPRCVVSPAHRY